MTPEEIDELERLMTAATPGPWRDEREPPPTRNRWFETHDGAPIESRGTHFALGVAVGVTAEPRDAAAIVALHNAAPALIAAAREMALLRERIAYLEAGLDAIHRAHSGEGRCLPTCASNLVSDEDCDCGYVAAGEYPGDFALLLVEGTADVDGAMRARAATLR